VPDDRVAVRAPLTLGAGLVKDTQPVGLLHTLLDGLMTRETLGIRDPCRVSGGRIDERDPHPENLVKRELGALPQTAL